MAAAPYTGVEIQKDYLKRFLAPKTDEWLLHHSQKDRIAVGGPNTLRPLAERDSSLSWFQPSVPGENIELYEESTIVRKLSELSFLPRPHAIRKKSVTRSSDSE